MTEITIAWIALPFFIGFVIYLLPQWGRWLALAVALVSAVYALTIFLQPAPLDIQLLDSFGVSLLFFQAEDGIRDGEL